MLGGLLNAASSRVQNSEKVVAKILTLGFFCVKTLFPSLPMARNKIDRSFLSASVRLIPLNFLFSSLIRFSSAIRTVSSRFCSCSLCWLFPCPTRCLLLVPNLVFVSLVSLVRADSLNPDFLWQLSPIEIGRSIGSRHAAVALGYG